MGTFMLLLELVTTKNLLLKFYLKLNKILLNYKSKLKFLNLCLMKILLSINKSFISKIESLFLWNFVAKVIYLLT
jgi:hypothetical protein